MSSAAVKRLYVDDERACPNGWDLARNYDEAIKMLQETDYYQVSLDHDLGEWNYQVERTGMTILTWLEERQHDGHVVPFITIHTANAAVRRSMERLADKLNRASAVGAFKKRI